MTAEPPASPVPEISPTHFLRVLTSRSVMRSYTDAVIGPEIIDALLQGMVSAPNAANAQAWSFIVIQDKSNIRRLRSFAPGVFGIPSAVVMACIDDNDSLGNSADRRAMSLCVAMAVQNLLLTAHAHGLGACPVHSFRAEPLRFLFGLPSSIKPVLLVPIGYPAYKHRPSQRRDPQEIISYERYGRRNP
ncbi:nitroreductase family protein [Streptomyces sp. DSM 118878]